MDILAWALKSQEARVGRIKIGILYWLLRTLVPKGVLMNRIVCGDLVHGLYRVAAVPEVIVVLDGLLDAAIRAEEIARRFPETVFWLAGNQIEQERFLKRFRPEKLVRFAVSSNTRDQSQKIVTKAMEEGIRGIGFIDYEFHVVRTTLTLVGSAIVVGCTTLFIPFAFVDGNRAAMLPELRELGGLIEALKLWRYQRRGHVATLQQAMEYYGLGKEQSLPGP